MKNRTHWKKNKKHRFSETILSVAAAASGSLTTSTTTKNTERIKWFRFDVNMHRGIHNNGIRRS